MSDVVDPVLARVVQHVSKRIAHLARRAQHQGVVAIGEDGTGSLPEEVQRTRDAHEQALEPAGERGWIRRLDDEMQVVCARQAWRKRTMT